MKKKCYCKLEDKVGNLSINYSSEGEASVSIHRTFGPGRYGASFYSNYLSVDIKNLREMASKLNQFADAIDSFEDE